MGERKVTIKDIAQKAGVSPSLVSFVMSNRMRGTREYRVKAETAEKILKIAEELHYQPNHSARSLRSGKSFTLGVILSDISNSFFAEIARYIEDEAFRRGYSVLFGSMDEDASKLEVLLEVFISKGIDGLILVPCDHSDEIVRKLERTGLPVVLVDREIGDGEFNAVLLDNEATSRRLCELLLERGYRRIEMVSYDWRVSNMIQRETGYCSAMKAAGLESGIRIHRLRHTDTSEAAEAIVREARSRGADAMLFATNHLALMGISFLFQEGKRIPSDFGLACFDRSEVFDYFGLDIIYARQPITDFAGKSMELMFKLLRGERRDGAPEKIVLEPEIFSSVEGKRTRVE